MDTKPEANVTSLVPLDVEPVWVAELSRVPVGRPDVQRKAITLGDLFVSDLEALQRDQARVELERRSVGS